MEKKPIRLLAVAEAKEGAQVLYEIWSNAIVEHNIANKFHVDTIVFPCSF
jgi:hypothetical protein